MIKIVTIIHCFFFRTCILFTLLPYVYDLIPHERYRPLSQIYVAANEPSQKTFDSQHHDGSIRSRDVKEGRH